MQAVCFFLLVLFFSCTLSDSGDFASIELRAAATGTYNSRVGGGAWNDGTNDQDIKKELQGQDYRCGDWVTHFLRITMQSTTKDASQCAVVALTFTADTTGQPGVAYGKIIEYNQLLLSRTTGVENGANGTPSGPSCSAPNAPGRGNYGRDCAPLSLQSTRNGVTYQQYNEEITYDGVRKFTAPIFSGNKANMQLSIRVCGLEQGEVIIARFDAQIFCSGQASPTGNLQAGIDTAYVWPVGNRRDTINTGAQTVPLKGVDAIVGVQPCTPPETIITTNDFNATITVYSSSQVNGGAYQRYIWYSWSSGTYKLQNVANANIAEVHTFDTACTFLHDGVTQFTQSSCGCEATFIDENQPQLFLNLNSSYYSTTYTTQTLDGILVRRHVRIDPLSSVTVLYVRDDNPNVVVRADFENGEYWVFTNYISGPQAASVFTLNNGLANSTCNCKRAIVMMVVVERDLWITRDDWQYIVTFVGNNLPSQFANNTASPVGFLAANMGYMYYDCPAIGNNGNRLVLAINDGYSYQQVRSALYSATLNPCIGSGQTCGSTSCASGTWASPSRAIRFAADQLATNQKLGQRVILMVNKGWNPQVLPTEEQQSDVTSAVTYAETTAQAKVLAVSFSTNQFLTELNYQVSNQSDDNLVYRYTAPALITIDTQFPVSIVSKICVAQANPCGSCCGQCEPTCGTCISVETCTPSTNCTFKRVLTGTTTKCCSIDTNPVDPCNTAGTCRVGVCNAATGQCSYTDTCSDPSDQCNSRVCNNGQCITTSLVPPNTVTSCLVYNCVNKVITSTAKTCPPTNCFTAQCVEGQGCVYTAVAVPACKFCDPADGIIKDINCTAQLNPNRCQVATCSTSSGLCSVSNKFNNNCRSTTDLCDRSFCDLNTGTCVTSAVTCPESATNLCNRTTGCVSTTGQCGYRLTSCSTDTSCLGQTCNVARVCEESSGNCVCDRTFTCAPTRAPTRTPTTAPTNAPTQFPTAPPGVPTPPPTSVPTSAPTPAPTPAPTELITCTQNVTCLQNACNQSFCLVSSTTDPEQALCSPPFITDCAAELVRRNDQCLRLDRCDAATGCVFTDVNCETSSDPCNPVVRDSTFPGCCRTIPFTCAENTACTRYDCVATAGVPSCVATQLCVSDPNNKCSATVCGGTSCVVTNVTCDSSNECVNIACNPATGACDAVSKNCTDNDLCTIDTCNPATGCVRTPVVCPTPTDPCMEALPCDPATGGCPVRPKVCDDNVACTRDTCVNGQCVFTPDDFFCQDSNPCIENERCTPTGCTSTPVNCSSNRTEFCINWTCIDFLGCSGEPRFCANETNGTCTLFNCSEVKRECEKTESPCLAFFGIVAGLIVAGLVVGVVAAALIIAGASVSGASYAISQSSASEKNQSINSNPLYRGHGRGMDVGLGA